MRGGEWEVGLGVWREDNWGKCDDNIVILKDLLGRLSCCYGLIVVESSDWMEQWTIGHEDDIIGTLL
ncbi:hypothetical protein HanXRQr2_Chr09g0364251 [Helianthus annuus]|uniref:Uncharacterized protein n=1 Tax=Helianthus annuus TaxID=4232 RepID=A0A9K3I2A3_HELAN|nr:hypothetical protein HanXRQr2_Chr09g0364251 [Helianthus annuus]KAJ0891251.1 hypothetical protein HanPSC8_Chr09g0351441 [Helianthus annuus]